jgi:outer membrane receptor protein involved in Fe transport
VVYRYSDQTNLRAAVSRTVNRPEFRELAPFEWTDVVGGGAARGNPDLVSANITSFDLRWEHFPNPFGVVAASVFYKDFTNPIERTLQLVVELQNTWNNVEAAENFGLELEFRRGLGFIAEPMEPFVLQLNYTYVDSQVNLGEDDQWATNTERSMVGQPDHVFNGVLEWQQPSWGTTLRMLYNFTGEKIFQAGGLGIPDVIEEPWASLDFVWRQDLSFLARGLGLKLSATNVLNEEVQFTGGREETFKRGTGIGLSLSYSLF